MNQKNPKAQSGRPEPVSLAPLETEQAIAALLAVKPPKNPEKTPPAKKPAKRKKSKSD